MIYTSLKGGSRLKKLSRIISVLLAALMIGGLFAGCSSQSDEADTITDETLLIAYTEELEPFLYTGEDGKLTGFDAELVAATFDSFKGDFTNYEFVKVEDGFRLGEDAAYTDEEGNSYHALIYCAVRKDVGTINEDYAWSDDIIQNDVVAVVSPSSGIKSYNDLAGKRAGIVSQTAATALSENGAVMNSLASSAGYATADEAFAALDAGAIDVVIIDDFSLCKFENRASYTVLNGALDTIEYGFAFTRSNDLSGSFNEAVLEISSTEYSDEDTLTPLVEKYFGSADVLAFDFEPTEQ